MNSALLHFKYCSFEYCKYLHHLCFLPFQGCDLLSIIVLLNTVNTTLGLKAYTVLRFEGFNTTKKCSKKVFTKAPSGAFFVFGKNQIENFSILFIQQ